LFFKFFYFELSYFTFLIFLLQLHLQLLQSLLHLSYLLRDLSELDFEVFIYYSFGFLDALDLPFQLVYCILEVSNLAICLFAGNLSRLLFLFNHFG
jgi:hypothetical protein